MRGCRSLHQVVICLALAMVGAPVLGAPTIEVRDALEPVLDALLMAYEGEGPAVVADPADPVDLVLGAGEVAWDDLGSVAVLPDATLTLVSDDAEARAFQRFATSAAGQRALIDAGLLPASVTVVDQAGKTVEVPQPVARLASPYGVATYLAYGVGAGDRIVVAGFLGARDPAGAAAMERVDPRFPDLASVAAQETTSVEYLATLSPDLVFAAARSEWVPSVEAIGIPVLTFDGESPAGLREAMRLAGSVLGPDAASRAEAWIRYYDDVLARVENATSEGQDPTTVLFTGTERTRVASGAMYQTALIEAAGGQSVTEDLTGYWNDVGVEQVLFWNPELILVPPYGGASVEAVLEDPEWGLLQAVQDERVRRMPKLVAPWDTPVPDSVLAVVWLAEVLHPEAAGLSCSEEVAFFYPRFYGYAIGEDEVAALCDR
jgi:iron complex transport system substrate-binding protein